MKTILATAYDINPYKGSEAATGWNFVLQIARYNKVVAITRKNNKENIEKYIKEFNLDASNIKFYYYDLPYWMRFWKKGSRGSALYFYLWQMFMPIFILKNKIKFDIAHNINFHADAFPTFLWTLNKPVVWGPINHNELIPKEYIKNKREYYKDRIKWLIKNINWNVDPFLFLSKKLSSITLGGNSSVHKRLRTSRNKSIIMSQVASNEIKINKKIITKEFNILLIGRFITIKSFDLALESFELFFNNLDNNQKKNITLNILGEGPLKKTFIKIVEKFNSKNNINFVGWVEKSAIDNYYNKSNIFFFPSHEGAGMVVAEALSHSLPIICFDNYGPGELTNDECAIRIPYTNYNQSIIDFSNALLKIYEDKDLQDSMSQNARKLYLDKYTWDSKGNQLNDIYFNLFNKGNK